MRLQDQAFCSHVEKLLKNYKKKNGLGAPGGLTRGWALRVPARPKSPPSLDHPAWATKLAESVTKNYSETVWKNDGKTMEKRFWKNYVWKNYKKNVLIVFPRH